jgi:prevent-host-death family protein
MRRRYSTAAADRDEGEPASAGPNPGGSQTLQARILYMTTLPLAEVRANLSRLVEEAERTHQRVEITKNGRRAAVLIGADDYDSLMETLDVLSDAETMAAIRESESLTDDQWIPGEVVEAELRAAGRLRP